MMVKSLPHLVLGLTLCVFATGASAQLAEQPQAVDSRLQQIVKGDHRTADFTKRDEYRHPYETLKFFGIDPSMTVIEVWPGRGWYSEILAPYLQDNGAYISIGYDTESDAFPERYRDMQRAFAQRTETDPDVYGQMIPLEMDVQGHFKQLPEQFAQMALTFRNVHNWLNAGTAQQVFNSLYTGLEPGGVLGVVEHRADPGTSLAQMIESGYVTEEKVIELAAEAGFELLERSEINANPKDTKDHPNGVWSLPPTLRGGDEAKDKYLAIGESDRMTLVFVRPVPDFEAELTEEELKAREEMYRQRGMIPGSGTLEGWCDEACQKAAEQRAKDAKAAQEKDDS